MIRPATAADLPFLWAMLAEASAAGEEAQPIDRGEADPELLAYLDGWGRPGDTGVVAVDDDGVPLAAAWYRRYSAAAPAYGFVDEDTPEVAIGAVVAARGRGLGHQLVEALLDAGHAEGFARLCLSVKKGNAPARKVYDDVGFVVVPSPIGPDGEPTVDESYDLMVAPTDPAVRAVRAEQAEPG